MSILSSNRVEIIIMFCLSFRIRKLSLNILGPEEDRALVSPPQLPAIVIEQPEPSVSSRDQSRRTSLTKNNTDKNV